MTDLLAARSQMALSLAFHILFAVVGMAMPLLMCLSEWRWLRTRDPVWLTLTRLWARGTAILFAVGAVSGTVLSFELGLLWPHFMEFAGPIIAMPFSLEGFAFFLEAIFLGLYLYGWERLPPRIHLYCGVMVLVCGCLSGFFVVAANAWMNTPAGFTQGPGGEVLSVDPVAAFFNPAMPTQVIHMIIAAFQTVGFAVAAIHAWMLLGDRQNLFHQRALALALAVGGVAALIQPLSGDFLAKQVARSQPVKLAAMESLWQTTAAAPLLIGGIPLQQERRTPLAIHIPYGLSFLAFGDPLAEVAGLDKVPEEEWPPVLVVHVAFQIMVGCGMAMAGMAVLAGWLSWRRRALPLDPWFLKAVVACGPLGVLALETGWVVTEVGRQPWIIQGVMKTADAVTPMPHLTVPFLGFTLLYLALGAVVVVLLRRQVFASPTLSAPAGGDHATS